MGQRRVEKWMLAVKSGKFCTRTFSIADIEPCAARINIDKIALVRNTIKQGKTLKNGG
jgi:hypothetical protein